MTSEKLGGQCTNILSVASPSEFVNQGSGHLFGTRGIATFLHRIGTRYDRWLRAGGSHGAGVGRSWRAGSELGSRVAT